MRKKMIEQRKERKNEVLVMSKLDTILLNQADQNTEIAVIKNEQKNTNDHLKTLNGKVATQEGRQQATDSSATLVRVAVETLQKQVDSLSSARSREEEKKLTFWERNADKLFWLLVASLASILFAKLN